MPESFPNNTSKEMIAANMFRHGARYWGYNDTDIDNFDPLVRLLIEACAVELYKVSNEIASVEGQMLEKLARLLTPDVHTAPKPAHAVIHARPLEPDSMVNPTSQFFYQKKIASKPNGPFDTNMDVFFSPAGNYRVVDGDIRYIVTGSDLYSINNWQYKETFFKVLPGKKIPARTAWVGMELNHHVKDLSGLSFFFDFKNHANKRQLFGLLPYSKWHFGDRQAPFIKGLWNQVTKEPVLDSFSGFDEFDINQSLVRHINYYYQDQFITLAGKEKIDFVTAKFPIEFESAFSPGDLKKLQKELVWISIEFPPEFDEIVLNDLTISINSIPVANRHLNEMRYRLQTNINIIPLLSMEQFLAIERVDSNDGDVGTGNNEYTSLPIDASEIKTKGTYSLRTGDMERFDDRSAIEYMNYLIELLRDESSAFAALGQDFVASLVRELNQNITQLGQKVRQNSSNSNQKPTYLLINPRNEGETIFVSYWTTDGELGNLIRSGTKLELYEGGDLMPESLVLLTNTTGGSNRLKETEVLNAYKNVLITRGRIVTTEDIRSYCQSILGDRVKKITIQKGVAVGTLPDEGLINTIEINLALENIHYDIEEWNDIMQDLLTRLKAQSALLVNYRIWIGSD